MNRLLPLAALLLPIALPAPAVARPPAWAASVLARPGLSLAVADHSPVAFVPAGSDLQPARDPATLAAALALPPGPVAFPWVYAGATVGGAAGFFGGAVAGYELTPDNSGEEWSRLWGALVGASFGETVFTALGAHLANHGRGSFARDLGVAVAGTVATMALAAVAPSDARVPVLVVGVTTQFYFVTRAERATTLRPAEPPARAADDPAGP